MARPTFNNRLGGMQAATTRSLTWLRANLGMWVGVGMCAVAATGCGKTRAQTIPTGPPLAVPAPPPRVIALPVEPEVAAGTPPIVEPPPAATAAPPPPPRTASRPTPPLSTPSTAPPVPIPVVPVVEPPRVVRPSAADEAEERRIQAILQQARRDIGRVTYQRLNTDGRTQYDQSRSLAEQAEQAIKDRNWLFAQTLAAKAATLAAELVARMAR